MADEKTIVDVLSLEGFRSTLDARLDEAQSALTNLTEVLRANNPRLGTLPDADYITGRYQTLYDEHLDRVAGLMHALTATQDAMTRIIENYKTTEERLAADASDISDVIDGSSASSVGGGTSGGDGTHA
jgi:ABC-type transporter Mla subunit MlaD